MESRKVYMKKQKLSVSLLKLITEQIEKWPSINSVYIYIYIYIYIYLFIIPVLVVTKSLCGYVANQVQYDMESAQYLG